MFEEEEIESGRDLIHEVYLNQQLRCLVEDALSLQKLFWRKYEMAGFGILTWVLGYRGGWAGRGFVGMVLEFLVTAAKGMKWYAHYVC